MTPTAADVHVWIGSLERAPEPCAALLDAEERARAARFVLDLHRRRFVVARALLRMVLGRALDVDPASLRFVTGPHGKPQLPGAPLGFNLSHSGERAAIAVASSRAVGIDLEQVRSLAQLPSLLDEVLSPHERQALDALPYPVHHEGVLSAWVRKEALVKARGERFPVRPSAVAVGLGPDAVTDAGFTVRSFVPCSGFVAAVAAEGNTWTWEQHPDPAAQLGISG